MSDLKENDMAILEEQDAFGTTSEVKIIRIHKGGNVIVFDGESEREVGIGRLKKLKAMTITPTVTASDLIQKGCNNPNCMTVRSKAAAELEALQQVINHKQQLAEIRESRIEELQKQNAELNGKLTKLESAPLCAGHAEQFYCERPSMGSDCLLCERDSLRKQNVELREALDRIVEVSKNDSSNKRCPCCQWVWVSSIDFKEHHHPDCKLAKALATQPEKTDG